MTIPSTPHAYFFKLVALNKALEEFDRRFDVKLGVNGGFNLIQYYSLDPKAETFMGLWYQTEKELIAYLDGLHFGLNIAKR
ncbi:hypothetical protein COK00_11995 [Bacillus cereus]|uniref:hypothetical protein n=1 Tax=Bacillus cereus TaxID=1396 RepID=UPI000BF3E64C|nr:hypothetical protein [Bacillus cereus]PFP65315.1 hypothetical protein COK00_11995 [Bacillus cereus]